MTILGRDNEIAARWRALHWAASVTLSAALLAGVIPIVVQAVVPPPVRSVLAADFGRDDEPVARPLRLGEPSGWHESINSPSHSVHEPPTARLFSETLVAHGALPRAIYETLVGIDPDSGEEIWRYTEIEDEEVDDMELRLRTAILDSDSERIFVSYQKDRGGGTEASGIAALSSQDGEVVWNAELGVGRAYDISVRPRQVDDGRLLVEVDDDAQEDVSTVLLDVASGDIAWESEELLPVAIAGDLVLGSRGDRGDARISAVSLDDDAQLWEVDSTAPYPLASSAERTLVKITGGVAIIDNDTGDVLESFGAPDQMSCRDPEQGLVVCNAEGEFGYHPLIIDMRAGTSRPCYLEGAGPVTNVDDGRVFLSPRSDDDHGVMLDMECNVVNDDLPGAVLDIVDGHAVVSNDGIGDATVEVYPLLKS